MNRIHRAYQRGVSQLGVSLVELLIVIGILAVIGAGLAAMMMNANKEARSVNARSDFSSLGEYDSGSFE